MIVLTRSIREGPEGLRIKLTFKDGESWREIDDVLISQDKQQIYANGRVHQMTIKHVGE